MTPDYEFWPSIWYLHGHTLSWKQRSPIWCPILLSWRHGSTLRSAHPMAPDAIHWTYIPKKQTSSVDLWQCRADLMLASLSTIWSGLPKRNPGVWLGPNGADTSNSHHLGSRLSSVWMGQEASRWDTNPPQSIKSLKVQCCTDELATDHMIPHPVDRRPFFWQANAASKSTDKQFTVTILPTFNNQLQLQTTLHTCNRNMDGQITLRTQWHGQHSTKQQKAIPLWMNIF